MKTLFILMLSLNSLLPVIKDIESNNDNSKIGDNGRAYGILQIHKICVDDVNRIYDTNYTHQDAFIEECAEEIFILYLEHGIKLYEKKYQKTPTLEEVVRMWNGGIYSGYKKSATLPYLRKYQERKNL